MKAILLGIAALIGFALSSCNSTIGLGRDLRILGSEMEKKADSIYNGSNHDSRGGNTKNYGGAPVY